MGAERRSRPDGVEADLGDLADPYLKHWQLAMRKQDGPDPGNRNIPVGSGEGQVGKEGRKAELRRPSPGQHRPDGGEPTIRIEDLQERRRGETVRGPDLQPETTTPGKVPGLPGEVLFADVVVATRDALGRKATDPHRDMEVDRRDAAKPLRQGVLDRCDPTSDRFCLDPNRPHRVGSPPGCPGFPVSGGGTEKTLGSAETLPVGAEGLGGHGGGFGRDGVPGFEEGNRRAPSWHLAF